MYHTGIKSNSTISAALRALQKSKVLYIKKRLNTSNKYWIDVQRLEELAVPYMSKRHQAFVQNLNEAFSLSVPATPAQVTSFIVSLRQLRKDGHEGVPNPNVYAVMEWFTKIDASGQVYKVLPNRSTTNGPIGELKTPAIAFVKWEDVEEAYPAIAEAYDCTDKHFLAYLPEDSGNAAVCEPAWR